MARPCGSGNGVTGATKSSNFQTFQSKMETARLSRPTWIRRDFKKFFRDFSSEVETARLRKRRDSKGNGSTGLVSATKMCTFKTFTTEVETAPKSPKVNLRSPRGQPGSNFHIWVQNLMGVLTIKFQSYPISTLQVISFLRSISTFSGKKVLTPEGFHSLGVFFSGSVSYVYCRNKKNAIVHHFA